jgi:predicted nucleotidyltransferase
MDMNTNEIIAKLQHIKPQLQRDYAVKKVGVFGSFSDGTYTENSDVDILVEFERPVGWRFFKLEKHLEKTLHRKVDLVTADALNCNSIPYVI